MDGLVQNCYEQRMPPYTTQKNIIVERSRLRKRLRGRLIRLHSAEKPTEAFSLRFDFWGL
jgi:hypothetical protein